MRSRKPLTPANHSGENLFSSSPRFKTAMSSVISRCADIVISLLGGQNRFDGDREAAACVGGRGHGPAEHQTGWPSHDAVLDHGDRCGVLAVPHGDRPPDEQVAKLGV